MLPAAVCVCVHIECVCVHANQEESCELHCGITSIFHHTHTLHSISLYLIFAGERFNTADLTTSILPMSRTDMYLSVVL